MTLAFYAPMKPPSHPVPSGDRNMARALCAALEYAGAKVTLASTLQTRDGRGDVDVQRALFDAASTEAARLIPIGKAAKWRAWISYHNYYKAPDLVGPVVAKALHIPYLQVESTRAKKRLSGPWAGFARAAEAAADAADLIFYFTEQDAVALRDAVQSHQSIVRLRPFIATEPRPYSYTSTGSVLSVGMMRAGDKLASYELIAATCAQLQTQYWHLQIAGDGPARAAVEAIMAPFGDKVTFLGALTAQDMATAYQTAAIFMWPGVNEAFGMAYIEAQAAGLPIIAQDRPGVRDVLPQGVYPDPSLGSEGLSRMLDRCLSDTDFRLRASRSAYLNATGNHMLPAAAMTLKQSLKTVGVDL
jgi:glycosyltransferase involved in cell wall biosynthesis